MKTFFNINLKNMKTISFITFICASMILIIATPILYNNENNVSLETYYDTLICKQVNITSYQLTKKQTDSTPKESASGKNLTGHPNACAISRDLKSILTFGDSVLVCYNGINNYYIVEDIMNKRYKNCIDILIDKDIKTIGYIIKNKTK